VVFDEFFRHHFALFEYPPNLDGPDAIQERFLALFQQLGPETSAIALRWKILTAHQPQWRALKSTTRCFLCLCRPSERMLPCGHSVCEECIEDYYTPSIGVYRYAVGPCPFCGVDTMRVFTLKPITVEPNVAAINGGGVRGIVALVLLKRL